MTVVDVVTACNEAAQKATFGERPAIVIEVGAQPRSRRMDLRFGPARLVGKVLGARNAGTLEQPEQRTGVRFFVDEIMREFKRHGLVELRAAGQVKAEGDGIAPGAAP